MLFFLAGWGFVSLPMRLRLTRVATYFRSGGLQHLIHSGDRGDMFSAPFSFRLPRTCRMLVICIFFVATPGIVPAKDVQPIRIPLTFEQNQGQVGKDALFLGRTGAGSVLLTKQGAVLTSPHSDSHRSLLLRWLHGSKISPMAESPTGGFANYYTSNNPSRWLTHIPMFSRVRYSGIYPGVDAVFYGRADQLEYDLEISPGANPADIAFKFDGAHEISSAPGGDLEIIDGGGRKWRLLAPTAYSVREDTRIPVAVAYDVSANNSISFRVAPYDRTTALVIDPVVDYSSFLPSSYITAVAGAKIDSQGNLIIAGTSGNLVGVVKLNSVSGSIIYSTHVGAAINEGPSTAEALALDSAGAAYIAGITDAPDFPVTSSNLGSCTTFCNAGFVVKLSSTGSLSYGTLLGSGQELPHAIAADSTGSAYVTGLGADSLLQTVNAYQPQRSAGSEDAFFAKLDPAGSNYVFASYFAGPNPSPNEETIGYGIGLDTQGNILLAGDTNGDPPLVNALQSGVGGLFLSKFAPDGKTLLFSTRFGSSQNLSEATPAGDALAGMAIGADNTVYLVGSTQSQDFPYSINSPIHQVLPNGYASGIFDMFAVAFDPSLTKLTYSNYLGSGNAYAMSLSPVGNLYISGATSVTAPVLQNPVVSDISSGGFFTELNPSGASIMTSEFGGHSYVDSPSAIAADAAGNVFLVGTGAPTFGGGGGSTNGHFGFPAQPDPLELRTGSGGDDGPPVSEIGIANGPQISLDTTAPFLTLRDAGSEDLHVSGITLGAGLAKKWGNCGNTVPAGTSCILTVLSAANTVASGTVTITSDAQPSSQTFSVPVPTNVAVGQPIGDQLWSLDVPTFFPLQFQGTSTATIPLTVWNVGAANATLNSIAGTGVYPKPIIAALKCLAAPLLHRATVA